MTPRHQEVERRLAQIRKLIAVVNINKILLGRIDDKISLNPGFGVQPTLISLLTWLKLRVIMFEKNQPILDNTLRIQVQLDRRQECIMVIQQALRLIKGSTDPEQSLNEIELINSLSKRSNADLLQILLTCQD